MPNEIKQEWAVWRLVLNDWVTLDKMDDISFEDVIKANIVLDFKEDVEYLLTKGIKK